MRGSPVLRERHRVAASLRVPMPFIGIAIVAHRVPGLPPGRDWIVSLSNSMPEKKQFIGRWITWLGFVRMEHRLFADGRFEVLIFGEEEDEVSADARGTWEVVGNTMQWRFKSTHGIPRPRGVDVNKILHLEANRVTVLESDGDRTDFYRAIKLVEASTNFDLDQVQPFLRRISRFIGSGFGSIEISRFIKTIKKLKPEETYPFVYPIAFMGTACPLRIMVYMDDFEAPDISFYTTTRLARHINNEIRKLDAFVRD